MIAARPVILWLVEYLLQSTAFLLLDLAISAVVGRQFGPACKVFALRASLVCCALLAIDGPLTGAYVSSAIDVRVLWSLSLKTPWGIFLPSWWPPPVPSAFSGHRIGLLIAWLTFIPLCLAIVWGLVGAVLAVRLYFGRRALARLNSKVSLSGDESVLQRLQSICLAEGTRVPSLVVSEDFGRPFLSGSLTQRIYIPSGLVEGSEARLSAVLSHEVAHVKHRDCLWNAASLFIRCLFWFQPLFWILHRKLKLASEEWADQVAVRYVAPEEYAALLLDLVAGANPLGVGRGTLLGVVESHSEIGKRVRRLLTANKSFPLNLSGRSRAVGWLIAALLLVGVTLSIGASLTYDDGLADPDFAYIPANADYVTDNDSIVIPPGLKVKLIISDPRSRQSWTANGDAVKFDESPLLLGKALAPMIGGGSTRVEMAPQRLIEARVAASDPRWRNNLPTDHIEVPQFPALSGQVASGPRGNSFLDFDWTTWISDAIALIPRNPNPVDVFVAFADLPWKTAGAYWPRTGRKSGIDFSPVVTNDPYGEGRVIKVRPKVPAFVKANAYRIVAFDQSGKETESAGSSYFSGEPDHVYMFHGNDVSEGNPGSATRSGIQNVGRIELQVRPYTWIEFRNVRLNPRG